MQGFVNLAADFGTAIATLIPLICYLGGGGFLLASMWGFWQIVNPGSHTHRRPFWPFATLFVAATLLSFDRMLNFANNTFGGGVQTSLSANMTSYQPPQIGANGFMGATPEDTLLNIINVFRYFFMSYGALIVLFALFTFYNNHKGQRHQYGHPIVQLVFGVAVMNVQSIATTVMGYFG